MTLTSGSRTAVLTASSSSSGNGGSSGRAATRNDATALTPDGRYIAFTSTATDLVDPPTAAGTGVYWRDERTGHTRLVAASGADPAISADGRYVAFESTHLN